MRGVYDLQKAAFLKKEPCLIFVVKCECHMSLNMNVTISSNRMSCAGQLQIPNKRLLILLIPPENTYIQLVNFLFTQHVKKKEPVI